MNEQNKKHEQNKARTRLFISIVVIAVILFSLILFSNLGTRNSTSVNGTYIYDSDSTLPQSMIGSWHFQWNQLLTPDEIRKVDTFMEVPSFWNSSTLADGSDIPPFGCATYSLNISGLEPGEKYSLKFPTVGTAGNFYVDSLLAASAGSVGTGEEEHSPKFEIFYYDFIAQSDTVNVTVQISNYEYARAGMWLPIEIGKADAMNRVHLLRMGIEYAILGILLFSFIVAITVIIILKLPRQSFNFVGTIVFMFLYQIVYGEKIILQFFPDISMISIVRIQYLVMYLLPIVAVRTILAFSNGVKTFNKPIQTIIKILTIVGIIFSVSLFVLPLYWTTSISFIGNVFSYIHIGLFLAIIILAMIDGNKRVDFLFFAGITLGCSIVFDYMYRATLIHSIGEISVIAYIIVIMSMGGMLLSNLIKVQQKAKLSETFEQAYLNSQIKSHFLFNALNTIAGTVHKDADKAKNLILSLSTFLRNIIDRENLKNLIPLEKELETVKAYMQIEQIHSEKIQVIIDIDDTAGIFIPPITLQPLVENAIKHGLRDNPDGGIVKIALIKFEDLYVISVADNGIGIDMERLKYIKAQLRRNPADADSKIGIGLVNVNARLVKELGRPLDIVSAEDEGTTVNIFVSALDLDQ